MTQPLGIRLPKEILEKINQISAKEMEDRNTIIKKLIILGYADFMKKKYTQEYLAGSLTLSQAADCAGLTIWEMEKHLVENGFKSSYSTEDLEKELKSLK